MTRELIDLAVALLGRAPSGEELRTWQSDDAGLSAVPATLLAMPEAQARFDTQGDAAALVASAYRALFDREADAEGLAYWQGELESGALTAETLIPALLAGARAPSGGAMDAALVDQRLDAANRYLAEVESGNRPFDTQTAQQAVAQVAREEAPVSRTEWIDLSVALLGRAPSDEELLGWQNEAAGVAGASATLLALPEAQARFDIQGDDAALVASAYRALFDREADAEGLAYWQGELESGALTAETLIPALLAGARAPNGGADDADLIDQRLEAATGYLEEVESGARPFDAETAREVVSQIAGAPVTEQPPEQETGSGIVVTLEKGSVVYEFEKASSVQDGISSVLLTEADMLSFEAALDALEMTADQNFGSIITFTLDGEAGPESLDLVTIDFVGDSPIRHYAEQVGYTTGFIDFALFNGELVLPEAIGVGPDTLFYNQSELYHYFGYDWQWDLQGGDESLSRPDGQEFSVSVELLDTLGIANLDEVFAAAMA
ncbi:DUF4214 domain-containing protein [uncultured Halomonas sp.]|uniref:DUF4214 domain-containing protein n=1 Tax=uncultured Halomonas sp. TaxID=173971 RepID=UPI0026289A4D|nr:DUF4214 domain-containing protein [uncultured Halomonas sp.]